MYYLDIFQIQQKEKRKLSGQLYISKETKSLMSGMLAYAVASFTMIMIWNHLLHHNQNCLAKYKHVL